MAGELGDQPGRVLVVEDDPVGRRTLELAVVNHGHEVVTAVDGVEALEVMRSAVPDLVLLDLVMPELDGFGVLEAVRSDPRLSETPILVISAVEDTESVARAIEMGAVDCLPKPFDPVLLRVRLRTALQQGRLRRLEQAYLRQEVALRQNERLATLGRLSAGLAHELNNPAGAALRFVRQVNDRLDVAQETLERIAAEPAAALVLAASRALLDGRGEAPAGALDAADRADDIAAVLDAAGVDDAGPIADDLVAAGLTTESVAGALAGLDARPAALAVQLVVARADIRDGVAQALDSVQRISDIIGALRSYSYLDQAERQSVDVRTGIADTLTMLGHKIGAGISVVREDSADLPPVAALGPQLNQVWTNLVDNAVDALGGTGTIVIRTRREADVEADGGGGAGGEHVVVEVEDDGPGIDAELVGRVFDPFVTSKEPGQGTGLGLNIAHQIVTEGHGGRIRVESEPGRTVFTVTLPVAGPAAAPGPPGG